MVTIKELQRSIAEEREKLGKAQAIKAKQIEKSTLQKELFRLKYRKAIATRGKGARLLRRAGKGILKAGKKAAPIIRKQARLIREQQLRDEALEGALKKSKQKKVTSTKFIPVKGKGKKKLFRAVTVKVPKKKVDAKPQGLSIFKELDF